MKDLFLKIKKRNMIFIIAAFVCTLIAICICISLLFGYFINITQDNIFYSSVVFLLSGTMTFVFLNALDNKLSKKELEIIKDDNEFREFRKFLKVDINSSEDLTYYKFILSYKKFETSKIPDNAARTDFFNSLKS